MKAQEVKRIIKKFGRFLEKKKKEIILTPFLGLSPQLNEASDDTFFTFLANYKQGLTLATLA